MNRRPHLFLLCSISVGPIDSKVKAACIAEILALRVPSPQRSGCG